ncbi:2-hydroxyacid dehydrogenase [Pseudoalteromonas holothuriae]|nr:MULTISPECIES: glyoxylate/hydroxypyruvate reductase A [unclassified Pseudoalteromonas]
MSLLVCVMQRNNEKLLSRLKSLLPSVEIYEWPNCPDLGQVEFVLAWNAPDELWAQLPNLKVVQSFGAGVDGIAINLLAKQVVVTRIVDNQLADDMAQFVLAHILTHKLRIKQYLAQQQQNIWKPKRAHIGNHVGVMGLGELGKTVANKLVINDFLVSGWSASPKQLKNITTYTGQDGLNLFLADLDYLVCLLPLTKHTEGILNKSLFAQLPSHCVLINVARGQHVNDEDLLWALDNDELAGASLDVFTQEPLDNSHPFWHHPQVSITPHCAALTSVSVVCEQIAINYSALLNNESLKNVIDTSKGY